MTTFAVRLISQSRVVAVVAASLCMALSSSARADKLNATPAAGQQQKAGDIAITLTDVSSAGDWIDASFTIHNTGKAVFTLKPAAQLSAKNGGGALEAKDLLTLGGKNGEITVNANLKRVGKMKFKATGGGPVTLSFQPAGAETVTWTIDLPPSAAAPAAAAAPAPSQPAPMQNRMPAAAPTPPPGAERQIYKVGDRGPAGGTIFFDKGNDSDGWRFLEVAPKDVSESAAWSNGSNVNVSTSTGVGTGKANTAAIIAAQGNGAYAAKLCADAREGGVTDWFLPSKEELDLVYKALGKTGAFQFAPYAKKDYWTSSHMNASLSHIQAFGDGTQTYQARMNKLRVRAIRAF